MCTQTVIIFEMLIILQIKSWKVTRFLCKGTWANGYHIDLHIILGSSRAGLVREGGVCVYGHAVRKMSCSVFIDPPKVVLLSCRIMPRALAVHSCCYREFGLKQAM